MVGCSRTNYNYGLELHQFQLYYLELNTLKFGDWLSGGRLKRKVGNACVIEKERRNEAERGQAAEQAWSKTYKFWGIKAR